MSHELFQFARQWPLALTAYAARVPNRPRLRTLKPPAPSPPQFFTTSPVHIITDGIMPCNDYRVYDAKNLQTMFFSTVPASTPRWGSDRSVATAIVYFTSLMASRSALRRTYYTKNLEPKCCLLNYSNRMAFLYRY